MLKLKLLKRLDRECSGEMSLISRTNIVKYTDRIDLYLVAGSWFNVEIAAEFY